MIIIAFSEHTSKILPRILCREFRHCAPIVRLGNHLVMYQFTNAHKITKIELQNRDIAILRAHGWRFIYLPGDVKNDFPARRAYSCVDLSKQAIGINNIFIQTPNALYKYIAPK
jgi:hypothetical protein